MYENFFKPLLCEEKAVLLYRNLNNILVYYYFGAKVIKKNETTKSYGRKK